jgi:hypothetical protein
MGKKVITPFFGQYILACTYQSWIMDGLSSYKGVDHFINKTLLFFAHGMYESKLAILYVQSERGTYVPNRASHFLFFFFFLSQPHISIIRLKKILQTLKKG